MEQKLSRFFNLVSVLGAACVASPAVTLFLGGIGIPGGVFFLPLGGFCSVVFGYLLQHLSAHILGQRVSYDGYDDVKRGVMSRFKVTYAMVPILLLILLSLLLKSGAEALFTHLAETGAIDRRVDADYTALVSAILFFLCGTGGIAVWFYPMERLSNIYVTIFGSAVFLAEFIFAMMSPVKEAAVVITSVCFALFVLCMMVIYNQSNLQRTYRGTVVSVASPSARFYNLLLVLVLLICLVLALGAAYIILSGLYLIGSFLFFLVMYKIFYGQEVGSDRKVYEYADPEEVAVDFTKTLVRNGGNTIMPLFFMMALVIVLLVLGSKTGILQKIVHRIAEALHEFFYTVKLGKQVFIGTNAADFLEMPGIRNYKDEKKKLQNAAIREYTKMAEGTDSYKRFLSQLSALPDAEAQLNFAYVMLVTVCRKRCGSMRLSDTPREIEPKVTHLVPKEEIDEITRLFEEVKYGERELAPHDAARVLEKMCAVIKRYIF